MRKVIWTVMRVLSVLDVVSFSFFTFISFWYLPHPLLSISYKNHRPPVTAVESLPSFFWPILQLIHVFLWQKKKIMLDHYFLLWQNYFVPVMLIFRNSTSTSPTHSFVLFSYKGPDTEETKNVALPGRDFEDQLVRMTWVYLLIFFYWKKQRRRGLLLKPTQLVSDKTLARSWLSPLPPPLVPKQPEIPSLSP